MSTSWERLPEQLISWGQVSGLLDEVRLKRVAMSLSLGSLKLLPSAHAIV